PRFAVGDRVTVRRMAPLHHSRCPRYVRGVEGTITAMHGGWPQPQTLGAGEPEALYTVAFAMHDLWGDEAEAGSLFIDLWESYLEWATSTTTTTTTTTPMTTTITSTGITPRRSPTSRSGSPQSSRCSSSAGSSRPTPSTRSSRCTSTTSGR